MDLFEWTNKLVPALPSDLVLDCFELARDIRLLDMQASPYDVSTFGEEAVMIETPEGKAEYARRQREFADRGAPLRLRIIEACDRLLDQKTIGASQTVRDTSSGQVERRRSAR